LCAIPAKVTVPRDRAKGILARIKVRLLFSKMKAAPEKRTGADFLSVNAALVADIGDFGEIFCFHCLPPAELEKGRG
jgi:hypothetical protein